MAALMRRKSAGRFSDSLIVGTITETSGKRAPLAPASAGFCFWFGFSSMRYRLLGR
jgi:hypothetical protein